jgi:hypothetical protein
MFDEPAGKEVELPTKACRGSWTKAHQIPELSEVGRGNGSGLVVEAMMS